MTWTTPQLRHMFDTARAWRRANNVPPDAVIRGRNAQDGSGRCPQPFVVEPDAEWCNGLAIVPKMQEPDVDGERDRDSCCVIEPGTGLGITGWRWHSRNDARTLCQMTGRKVVLRAALGHELDDAQVQNALDATFRWDPYGDADNDPGDEP